MYVVDAAGQQTYFTARYYEEHTSEFAGHKLESFTVVSGQPLPPQPAYVAETLPLAAGSTTVHVHYVQVLTQPLGSAVFDDVYGVLGMDALDERSREVVRMKFTENLSYKEISVRTGLKIGHVGYLLHHALKAMAEELSKNGVVR